MIEITKFQKEKYWRNYSYKGMQKKVIKDYQFEKYMYQKEIKVLKLMLMLIFFWNGNKGWLKRYTKIKQFLLNIYKMIHQE